MENPNATLLDIFSAYLADVPWQYKKALLTEVASLSSRLQRVTLLSPHTTVYQRRRIETQILIGA
jgi:hypothetical protein